MFSQKAPVSVPSVTRLRNHRLPGSVQKHYRKELFFSVQHEVGKKFGIAETFVKICLYHIMYILRTADIFQISALVHITSGTLWDQFKCLKVAAAAIFSFGVILRERMATKVLLNLKLSSFFRAIEVRAISIQQLQKRSILAQRLELL